MTLFPGFFSLEGRYFSAVQVSFGLKVSISLSIDSRFTSTFDPQLRHFLPFFRIGFPQFSQYIFSKVDCEVSFVPQFEQKEDELLYVKLHSAQYLFSNELEFFSPLDFSETVFISVELLVPAQFSVKATVRLHFVQTPEYEGLGILHKQ